MNKFLVLDTETTGLDKNAEIVEICIIDNTGKTLINQRIKPVHAIPEIATAIHGIIDDDVKHCPTWRDVYDDVMALLTAYPVYIYNAKYDLRLIEQTTALYPCLLEKQSHQIRPKINARCVMNEMNKQFNQNKKEHFPLAKSCDYMGIDFDQYQNHNALYDCQATLHIIEGLNYFYESNFGEKND